MEQHGRIPTLFAAASCTADWYVTNGGAPPVLGVVAKIAFVRRGARVEPLAPPGLAKADRTPAPAPPDIELPPLRVFARVRAPGYERVLELQAAAPCFDSASQRETIVFTGSVPAAGVVLGDAVIVVGSSVNGEAPVWPTGDAARHPRPHVFGNRRVRTGPIAIPDAGARDDLPFIRPNPRLYPAAQKRSPTPPSLAALPFVAALDSGAANDRASAEVQGRTGDYVPAASDTPFDVSTIVTCLRPSRHDLTVVVKASCDLVPGGPATLRPEPERVSGDVYEDDEPAGALVLASDLAPIKQSCDVLVYAPATGTTPHEIVLRVRGSHGSIERKTRRARDLAPVSPHDPSRVALLGTYDAAWFATRWPHFAADLDARHFQAAPPAQRLDAANGDEAYEILGTSPERPRLSGSLPGVRPVAVARRGDGQRRAVPLRLDTIAFFVDEQRVDLVWRGILEVSDDDAPEIDQLFVTSAPVHGATPDPDEIEARFRRASQHDDEPPAGVAEPHDEETGDDPDDEEPDDPATEDETGEPGVLPVDLPRTSPEDLAASMRAAGDDPEEIADLLEGMRDEPEPEAAAIPADPEVEDARAVVMRRLESKETLSGLDLSHADLSGLDLSGQDLGGMDLTGALLASADLRGACLDDAELAGAICSSADLRGARAANASFHHADLRAARLEGAHVAGASFTGASLEGAVFDEADLSDARLYDVRAAGASFRRTVLAGARAEGALVQEGCFAEAILDGSVWERADLTKASFEAASLRSTSLYRARCDGASFVRADLTEARLARAVLVRSPMMKANLFEANVDRADLRGADLRGACLHGLSANGAKLAGARLDGAITSYSLVASSAS